MRPLLGALSLVIVVGCIAAGCENPPAGGAAGTPQPTPNGAAATTTTDVQFVPAEPVEDPDAVLVFKEHAKAKSYEHTVFWDKRKGCGAVLIGPTTLLTANHCVKGQGVLSLRTATGTITVECTLNPNHVEATGAGDFAYCQLDGPRNGPPFLAETIVTESQQVARYERLLVMKYLGDSASGAPRVEIGVGMTWEASRPSLTRILTLGEQVTTGSSGAPAFAVFTRKTPTGEELIRAVVGVNSKIAAAETHEMILASVASTEAALLLKQHLANKRTSGVCGFNSPPVGWCRQ